MCSMRELIMELRNRISLSKVRLEYAKEALEDSQDALKRERYRNSANRSYYAVFYAMRAVLAFDELDKKNTAE